MAEFERRPLMAIEKQLEGAFAGPTHAGHLGNPHRTPDPLLRQRPSLTLLAAWGIVR
jgi:hypothetical protein